MWPPDPFYPPHQLPNHYIWPPPQAHQAANGNPLLLPVAHQVAHAGQAFNLANAPHAVPQVDWNHYGQGPIFHQGMGLAAGGPLIPLALAPVIDPMPAINPPVQVYHAYGREVNAKDAFSQQIIALRSSVPSHTAQNFQSPVQTGRSQATKHPLKTNLGCQAEGCAVKAAVSCTNHHCKQCCIKGGGCTGLKSHNIKELAELHKAKTVNKSQVILFKLC